MSENNGKSTALTIATNRAVQAQLFSREEVELIKTTICKGATDEELALFIEECNRKRLDPFSRQIYAIKRWDSQAGQNVMTMQTGIDGYRLLAERTGKYAGQIGPWWCGSDGVWKEIWLEDAPPVAARVGVLRSDFKEPIYGIAKYKEFIQRNKDGKPNHMWATMPDNQLAKCAEAQAIRKAFPNETSGMEVSGVDQEGDHIIDITPPERESTISRQDIARIAEVYEGPSEAEGLVKADVPATPEPTREACHGCGIVIEDTERIEAGSKKLYKAEAVIKKSKDKLGAPHCLDCYRQATKTT